MNLQIYVLGDVSAFVSALNSVAMVLGVNSFVTGAGLLGAMISLIAFCLYLFNKEAGASILPGGSPLVGLVVFFIFFTSIQIKSKVTIEDAFTGNASVVDGVPVLISLPSAVITTTAYKVFNYSNTAYQSTNGSFMSMGQTGFVAPLKILRSLRDGIDKTDPLLAASLRQFIIDCTLGTNLDLDKLESSPDALGYILASGRATGLTVEFNKAAPSGTATTCLDMKDQLLARVIANITTPLSVDLGGQSRLEKNVNQQLDTKTASGTPLTSTQVTEAVDRVMINSFLNANQSAQDFMKNTLIYNTATNAFGCLDKAGDGREFSNCDVMMNQAYESWKVDSAGAGTLFTKTMLPAMVFLQLMFYTLAPIVIGFALVKGAAGISMYIKYLGFGVWTMSWLPVAAGIQMYIQNNVQGKLQMVAERALTFSNFKYIYADAIGTNLALASDMLAATPLVTATILGVSAMAMTRLTGQMGGINRTDDKLLSPELNKNGGFYSQAPSVSMDSNLKGNANTGLAVTGANFAKISSSDVMSQATESTLGEANSKKAAVAQSLQDASAHMKRWTDAQRKENSNVAAFDSAAQNNLQIQTSKAKEFSEMFKLEGGQRDAFEQSLQAQAGLTTMFGGVNTALKKARGEFMSTTEAKAFNEKYASQIAESDTQTETMRRSAQNAFVKAHGSDDTRSQQMTASLNQSFEASATADKAYRTAVGAQQSVGTQYSAPENEFGHAILSNPEATKMLAAAVKERQGQSGFEGRAGAVTENLKNKTVNMVGANEVGHFRALQNSPDAKDRQVAANIMAQIAGQRGVTDTDVEKNKGAGAPAASVQLSPSAPQAGTPAGNGVNASSQTVLRAAGGRTTPAALGSPAIQTTQSAATGAPAAAPTGGKLPAAKPATVAVGTPAVQTEQAVATGAPVDQTTQPVTAGAPAAQTVQPVATGAPVDQTTQPVTAGAPAAAPIGGKPSAAKPANVAAGATAAAPIGGKPSAAKPAIVAAGATAAAPTGGKSTAAKPANVATGTTPAAALPAMPPRPPSVALSDEQQDKFSKAREELKPVKQTIADGEKAVKEGEARLTPEQMRDAFGMGLYKDSFAAADMKWDQFEKDSPIIAGAIKYGSFLLPVGEGVMAAKGAIAAVKASRAGVAQAAEKVASFAKGWTTPQGGSALTHAKVVDTQAIKAMGFKSEEAFLKASKSAEDGLLAAQKKQLTTSQAYINEFAGNSGLTWRGKRAQAGAGYAGTFVAMDQAGKAHEKDLNDAQAAHSLASQKFNAYEQDVKARYATPGARQ